MPRSSDPPAASSSTWCINERAWRAGEVRRAESGGVGIDYDVAGPEDGRPVILLHGFPDSARLWRNQVPALVEAGLRVLVPDQRGCGRSDKPAETDAYNLLFLVGDALAVLDDLGIERAAVVGHDWG